MLKKTIKYTDLDGQPAEEDAYFNLTKAEAIELNIRNDLEVIGRSKNQNEIMDTFQRILKMSYGVRTGDGKFLKEERDWKVFVAGEAYSELFMEIWQRPEYAAEFIRGILPAGVIEAGEQASKSALPEHLRNHPSMQGHQAPKPQGQPAPSEAELRAQAYPPEAQPQVQSVPTQARPETPAEMEARIRMQIEQERAVANANTPPATGVTTPEDPQNQPTNPAPRDELI